MSNTVNNNIPFVPENTIDPAAGLNESLNIIDMMLQLAVLSVNANTPPASPAEGDRYIIGTAPTGAWAGWAGFLARYLDGYWRFLPARLAFSLADGVLYGRRTTTWLSVAGSGGVAWGSITGTLSAQTDLANALSGKVNTVAGKQLSTEDFTSTEKTKLSGIATGATANDTDANLKSRANHTGVQAISTVTDLQSALDGKIPLTQRGAASGVATLDAAGKIPTSQLPPLAVNEVFTVASQAAMLALTAERGDVAIRTDLAGQAFILSADAPGTLANWISLQQAFSIALAALNALTPAADRLPYFDSSSTAALAVFTAQARTLLAASTQAAQKAVLGVDQVTNTSDANKPVSIAQQAALDLKLSTDNPAPTGRIGLNSVPLGANLLYITNPPGTLSTVSQGGIRNRPTFDPSIVTTAVVYQAEAVIDNNVGTITDIVGYRWLPPTFSGSTPIVSINSGFWALHTSSAQTLDYRGFRGSVNLTSGAQRWNLYADGTAPNHMNGDLRIGTLTQNGTDKLTVSGSASFSGPLRLGPVALAARPSAALWPYCTITVTDAPGGPQLQMSNGVAWKPVNAGEWSALTLVTGFTAGTSPAQYRIIDDVVELRGKIVITAALGLGAMRQFATMPAGYRPSWLANDTDPLRLPICNVTSGMGGCYLNALRTGIFSVGSAGGYAAGDIIDLSNIRYSFA